MNRIFSFPGSLRRASVSSLRPGQLSRRTVLKGAGGAALGLPFLEAMRGPRSSLAQTVPGYTAEGAPKRFVVFFTPNGTIREHWTPNVAGRDFDFKRILQPIEAFRDKLLVIDGVDQTGTGGDGHQNGMQGMLTGQTLNPGPFEGGNGETAGWANGISVDQRVAQVIGGETPFRSLELGVQTGGNENNWNRMSLLGPDQPVPPENSPYVAYDRLFSDFHLTPDEAALREARDGVVLDAVQENFQRLRSRVGHEDKQRLDQHITALEEIESRLGKRPSAALDACEPPVLGGEQSVNENANFPLVGQLQMDLLVMALACDQTRVASLMWNRSVGQARHEWADAGARPHHDYSHDGDENAETIEFLTRINVWYAEQFAYLLGKLDQIPEGEGTMLDNTVVFWCNELERGNSHSRRNAHYVVAGGAGYFDMGRCLKFDYAEDVNHNDLLLSLLHAMGIEDESFGNPEWCTGPLDGMLG